MATGYKFPILNSDGTTTINFNTTITDALPVNPDGPGIFSTWGYGGNGILGNGQTVDYSSPIQIGALSTWKQLNKGVGVKTDGTLWTWGVNTNGELGNGNTINYSSPVQVGSSTNWSKLCDDGIGFAIKTDGTLWAWGLNNWGQLGNGTTVSYSSPIQIGSLTNWNKIAMYSTSAVAIKTDGTLWAWGSNANGQLGNGTTVYYSSPIQIGALTNWSQVSIGIQTAATKTDGTLWAWGYNGLGGLGNGTTVNYSSPIQIGALTNWSQVACGFTHFIATKTDGTLWASGENQNGQLGGGGVNVNYSSPIQIGALTDWRKVKADNYNSFAIKTNGTLWSWGQNGNGSLGIGDNSLRRSPVQVGTLTNWNNINAYGGSSVAIQAYNTLTQPILVDMEDMFVPKDQFLTAGLWGWGYSSPQGNLGPGNTNSSSSPVQVSSLTNWKQVYNSAYQASAIKTDGTLWAWGYNNQGALGNGNTTAYSSPIQVGLLANWKYTHMGYEYCYGIKQDGTLWAWGVNHYGQLGNGNTIYYSSPVQIGSLTNWKYITTSYPYATIALKTDGTLWSWGGDFNNVGALGTNTVSIHYSSPVQVGSLTNWKTIGAGGSNCVAVKTDGTLWGWGDNSVGQLNITGLGFGTENRSSPILVAGGSTWSTTTANTNSLGAAFYSSSVVKPDGTLWSWGYNSNYILGNGTNVSYSSPIQIGSLTNWSKVSVLSDVTAHAIKTDGTLWCWGTNTEYNLGVGTINTFTYSSPVQVGLLTNWKEIAHGSNRFTLALKTDGTLWTWGNGSAYSMGNGSNLNQSSPIQVGSLSNWTRIGCSPYAGFALNSSGQIYSWGNSTQSEAGSAGTSTPSLCNTSTDWSTFAAAGNAQHILAIKTNGTLWCWGYNAYGQLGIGNTIKYSSPVQIGSLTTWSKITVGRFNSFAIKTDGTLWAWGWNNYGQLGNGTTTDYSSPIQIGSLTNWTNVTAGSYHTLFGNSSGNLYSCGYGGLGVLGGQINVAYNVKYSSPIQIGSLNTWKQAVCVSSAIHAIKTDGTLWGWGYNAYGNLGNGFTSNYSSPIQIGLSTNWKYIDCNFQSNSRAALKTDGTLWMWGLNTYGQLGNGTTINYSSPIQVGALTSWKQISLSTNALLTIQAPDYYYNQ